MKFKKIIVLIFFFVLLCICFYNFNLCKIKISIEVKNISASNIEKYLTCDLIKEFLKIRQIRDFVAFSKDNSCSVYCKIYPFVSSYSVIEKIETKLKLLNSEILKEAKISIDYDFDTKYDSFLVISSEFASYPTLMDCCDKIENLLLNMRLAKKILKMGKQQKAVYVYLKIRDDSLVE